MTMPLYDVIVVGAGHAGIEAAWAAARLGCSVAICTLSDGTIGHMPCNPAIGGTAKGHLVREIDALGGLMGKAIDATGIQFKLLNRSRGPAVWSPRAQADKRRYSAWVRETLEAVPEIDWIFTPAHTDPCRTPTGVSGLELEDGSVSHLPVAGDHDRDFPERTGSHRSRAASRPAAPASRRPATLPSR